jgi:Cys-rich protein (TIGR01571 family)
MFEAEIDGKRFLATVPPGGIGKGETFSCVMQTMAKPGPSVPFGSWRDGLCNCFRHGICHPFLLNTIVCPLLALGQVMTRMQLDAFGHPLKTRGNAHASMFVITLFWAGMNGFIYVCYNYKWFHNMPLTIPDYIAVALLNFTLCLYTFYVVSTTRAAVRAKYEIQEQRFFDLEDNCCATFCLPCTICQLGRHTAPYDMLDARCCSKTGLKETVSLDYLDKATIP